MRLPGMTEYPASAASAHSVASASSAHSVASPLPLSIIPHANRPIVMLATAAITHDNIFTNGLYQNVYVIYRMFEAMGWIPIMIVNTKPTTLESVPWYMHDLRLMIVDDCIKSPIPVKLYIEIGMSIEKEFRNFFKLCGAKICKLYLGNILNIDVETPMFYPKMYFSHHIIGEQDDIWVSPHYYQHSQYARAINHIDIETPKPMVAPYVWDPQILTDGGKRSFSWRPCASPAGTASPVGTASPAGTASHASPVGKASDTKDDVFLILEPNISFQKCSLIPLMILEAWFRKNPTWKGRVVLVNGKRLENIPFFQQTIQPTLTLHKEGRIEVRDRMDILTILKDFPSAIPLCHQWNNEYNYMVLEFFASQYPVLHNASDWKDYGYYYEGSDIAGAVTLIDRIRTTHVANLEAYKGHARALAWKHSPYNPEIQKGWAALI